MMGFEPTTFGTTIRRSNQLNYNHHVFLRWQIYYFILFSIQKKTNKYNSILQKVNFEKTEYDNDGKI